MTHGRTLIGGAALAAAAFVLFACTTASDGADTPETAPAGSDPPVATSVPSATSTTASVPTSSSTTVPTTTTTVPSVSSTSTTSTEPTPTTSEVAQSRPPDRLARPRGYGRFEPGPVWEEYAALTGLAADPTVTSRPALAVKIDNAPDARPQWNLADADLIIEENVELITRFIAVYQANVPDRIGPVRSARMTDLWILPSMNRPILAWSGGNDGVTDTVEALHEYGWLSNLSALETSCFYRSSSRSAPHNLLLDPTCAWLSTTHAGPARPVVTHDTGGLPPWPGLADDRFTVDMDGLTVTWVWDAASGRYLRRQRGDWHVDLDGGQVAAHNVVVMTVEYGPSAVDDRSPEALTVGQGPVVVHRNGVAIQGSWARSDLGAVFSFTAADGTPLTLTPGTTFIELTR